MSRYFFNIEDGETILDREGLELTDIAAARSQAVVAAGQMLAESNGHFWNGAPWRMWVTNEPNGGGTTFFALEFRAMI
jgi:hypothetical protein